MTQLSNTLPLDQEAKIIKKIETAKRLASGNFPAFLERAQKIPAFNRWFERRPETKMTPELGAAFIVDWERDLRADALSALQIAELDALPDDDTASEPFGALPMTRSGGVHHTRENEDGERDGDGDGEESEDDDPVRSPSIAADFVRPEKPYPGDDDPGVILLAEWCNKFYTLPDADREEWERTHIERMEWAGPWARSVYLEPLADATIPDTLADFAAYSETVRRIVTRGDNVFAGSTLADDVDDGSPDYVIAKMVPAGPAVTVAYGLPDHCKSALAHKMAVVVASEALEFDGAPTLHGPVLYLTADSGARKRQVINRMRKISARLNAPYTDRLVIVDDAVNLLEPASVAKLLEKHPGPWAMIVIDPLVKCVGGADLAQAGVMTPALAGAMRLGLETGAAIMVVTHEPRGDKGHAYGSIFGDADATAILHVVRRFKDQARDGDAVTVAVEKLKNDAAPDKPFAYRIEEAYLAAAGESAGKRSVPPAGIERDDMRTRLPTTWRPIKGSQALLDDLMPARLSKGKGGGRETLYRRLREAWEAAGLIEQKDGRIRRVA